MAVALQCWQWGGAHWFLARGQPGRGATCLKVGLPVSVNAHGAPPDHMSCKCGKKSDAAGALLQEYGLTVLL
eukprot:SAG22_NODE_182_length_16036_cov_13.692226_11_plen_72_part_00